MGWLSVRPSIAGNLCRGQRGLSANKKGADEVDMKKRKVYEHGLANPTSEISTDLRCILAVLNGQP